MTASSPWSVTLHSQGAVVISAVLTEPAQFAKLIAAIEAAKKCLELKAENGTAPR